MRGGAYTQQALENLIQGYDYMAKPTPTKIGSSPADIMAV
jgi:hypothetical protein